MKQFILIMSFISTIMLLSGMRSYSQTTIKYFDSNWMPASKEMSFYQTDITKDGDGYHSVTSWVASGKLYGTSNYVDSNLSKGIGAGKKYYETGELKDSILYNEKGKIKTIDEFSENGTQLLHAYYDSKDDDLKAIQYDEKGNKKSGFVTYQRPPKYLGGTDRWINFLQTNLKANTPTKNKAPGGIYTVIVSFLIDENGKIKEVQAENDPGYGTAEEAIRVVQKSPKWIPAVQNDKAVVYHQRQPISFQVMEAKR